MSVLESFRGGVPALDRLQQRIRNPFQLDTQNPRRKQDFAGGFVITEILANGKEGRKIRLVGNQMPHQPFEGLGGDQRLVKQYYAGNDEASVQVLGPEEPDVVIRGMLTDRRLQDPSLYGSSTKFAESIDKMRFEGSLVKIQLGEWIRYGHIKSARFPMRTLGHLDYQITFSITGFNFPTNRSLLGQVKQSPFDVNQELLDEASRQQELAFNRPPNVNVSIFERFSGLWSDFIAEPIASVTGFVDSILTAGDDIQNSRDRILGQLRAARTNISRFNRAVGVESYSQPSLSVAEETSTAVFLAERRGETWILSSILANYTDLIVSLRDTIPLRRHLVKQGETLQNLAMRYYNDGTLWSRIYDHNSLTSTLIVPGDILEIPRL